MIKSVQKYTNNIIQVCIISVKNSKNILKLKN